MKKLFMATAAAVAMMSTAAHAADIKVTLLKDTKVPLWVININGKIELNDGDKFAKALDQAKVKPGSAIVSLNSAGGNMVGGVVIARIIKHFKFDTYVPPGDNAYCTSMCANIWLAGTTKYVDEGSRIGFHTLYDGSKKVKVRDERADRMMLSFYNEMGLSNRAGRILMAADPDEVTWLSDSLAEDLGIKAETLAPQKDESKPKAADDKPAAETKQDIPAAALAPQPIEKQRYAAIDPKVVEPDATPYQDSIKDHPPVKAEDEPKHVEHHTAPRRHVRYAGGGGRSCGVSVPLPYIGGITFRVRC
jgi:hypothetical protein